MRPRLFRLVLSALLVCVLAVNADASWLSDITGINIDIPAGRVTFGPPET